MDHSSTIESLEEQLRSLYAEREHLSNRFGASSADEITTMVECLEAQLKDFYGRYGSVASVDDSDTSAVLSQLQTLSTTLDPMFAEKQVVFEVVNDRPTLRAVWKETNTRGEAQ